MRSRLVTCEMCGKQEQRGPAAKYCSECSSTQGHSTREQKPPVVREFVCVGCGGVFEITGPGAARKKWCDACNPRPDNRGMSTEEQRAYKRAYYRKHRCKMLRYQKAYHKKNREISRTELPEKHRSTNSSKLMHMSINRFAKTVNEITAGKIDMNKNSRAIPFREKGYINIDEISE